MDRAPSGLLLLRLFGREMDLYYDSSVGGVDKEIQDMMSRATELDVDDVSSSAGAEPATIEQLTKDCLDGKEKND